ncbi:hypothetical protein B296_00037118 [Ensete ventricosum]|uniref:Uncharacterized protein n=1 Tax=Ensete ventricosum TaxID=4639 RepID=A0A426WZB3_ENSVE|nr:hypothetical protein B296_00037118 [Ensete ventricosum]
MPTLGYKPCSTLLSLIMKFMTGVLCNCLIRIGSFASPVSMPFLAIGLCPQASKYDLKKESRKGVRMFGLIPELGESEYRFGLGSVTEGEFSLTEVKDVVGGLSQLIVQRECLVSRLVREVLPARGSV